MKKIITNKAWLVYSIEGVKTLKGVVFSDQDKIRIKMSLPTAKLIFEPVVML